MNSIDLRVPEISSVAGNNADGVIIGRINESNPVAVLFGSPLINIAQVLRKDVTTTGFSYFDVTTAATNTTAYLYYRMFSALANGNAGMSEFSLYEDQYSFPTVSV